MFTVISDRDKNNPFTAALMAASQKKAFEVWPENWPAYLLFRYMQTQWDYAGMGQRVGLKYLVLAKKMDRMGLTPELYDELENDVRVMEMAALEKMNEKD